MDRITKSFLEEFSKVKMTRYDTHLYKLKDSIYKALKYSLDEYGRIRHFE